MNVLSIDICTTIYVALTLYNRASRALEEIKAHRSRFEKTEALLKLVEGIRRSKTTTTTIRDRVTPSPPSSSNPSLFSEGCEVWIDQNISCTEHVLSEIEEVIKLEREVERLSWKEKIEWVMRHKSVVENLGVRLDQCYLSLMATLIMLELAYQIGGRMGMGSWRGRLFEADETPHHLISSHPTNNNPPSLPSIPHAQQGQNQSYEVEKGEGGSAMIVWYRKMARKNSMEAESLGEGEDDDEEEEEEEKEDEEDEEIGW